MLIILGFRSHRQSNGILYNVMLVCVMLDYFRSGYVVICFGWLWHSNLCYVRLC